MDVVFTDEFINTKIKVGAVKYIRQTTEKSK
jgi:hypothetical protein